jgi:hypothetical protein
MSVFLIFEEIYLTTSSGFLYCRMFDFQDADCVRLYESCVGSGTSESDFTNRLGLLYTDFTDPVNSTDPKLKRLNEYANAKFKELKELYSSEQKLREAMTAEFFWMVMKQILPKCGNKIWNNSTERMNGLRYVRKGDRRM